MSMSDWEQRKHELYDPEFSQGDQPKVRRSRLGLDEPQTWMQKFLLTMASLGVLSLVLPGLMLSLVHVIRWPQPWRTIIYLVAEIVFIFLLLVMIYLWWKPPWFKEIYLMVESKMVYLVYSIPFWFVFGVVLASFQR